MSPVPRSNLLTFTGRLVSGSCWKPAVTQASKATSSKTSRIKSTRLYRWGAAVSAAVWRSWWKSSCFKLSQTPLSAPSQVTVTPGSTELTCCLCCVKCSLCLMAQRPTSCSTWTGQRPHQYIHIQSERHGTPTRIFISFTSTEINQTPSSFFCEYVKHPSYDSWS